MCWPINFARIWNEHRRLWTIAFGPNFRETVVLKLTYRSFCMNVAFLPSKALDFDRPIDFKSCSRFCTVEYCSSYFTVNLSIGYRNYFIIKISHPSAKKWCSLCKLRFWWLVCTIFLVDQSLTENFNNQNEIEKWSLFHSSIFSNRLALTAHKIRLGIMRHFVLLIWW